MLQRQLQAYFYYVLKEIDYETFYAADFIDQTAFPDNEEVVEEIKELISVLKRYDFSRLGYDIIGRIFEGLIPIQERHNLGQYFTNPDVVDMDVWMAKQIPTIDPSKISPSQHQKLEREFTALASRPIEHILKELGASSVEEISLNRVNPTRRKLDEIIMGEILGLTEEEQFEVYRAVIDLVKSRIEKAKSVQKRRRAKEGLDIDLLIKTVMEKIGSETLGKFYQEKILNQEEALYSRTLPEPTDEIKAERDLYGWRLYSGRRSIECKSDSEAQYLKVWLEAGLTEIKVPQDGNYLKKIVPELVAEKKKIDKTINSYLDSILDIKLRARILRQLWQRLTEEESLFGENKKTNE
jgi:hypothetical protein